MDLTNPSIKIQINRGSKDCIFFSRCFDKHQESFYFDKGIEFDYTENYRYNPLYDKTCQIDNCLKNCEQILILNRSEFLNKDKIFKCYKIHICSECEKDISGNIPNFLNGTLPNMVITLKRELPYYLFWECKQLLN